MPIHPEPIGDLNREIESAMKPAKRRTASPALFLLSLSTAFLASSFVQGEPVSFNRDIRPILSDRCFACHGPDAKERKGELRLDVAEGEEGAYRIRDGRAAIAPGSIEKSSFWDRITSADPDEIMPPPKAHKKPLSPDEQQRIKQWIEAGAAYKKFWAFEPPVKPKLPEVKKSDWSPLPIDRLVLATIEAKGLAPSPEADKRTLIRRLTFDLTGLPPTREEIRAFLADESPDAWEKTVDRLLQSKPYGEHMARYWLDLVRFADTNGMHKDFYRNFIAYRDWIIRAFNDNLGYDDLLRYQLAGDLMPNATRDQLVASGFNRMHLIIDRGTALPEESYTKNVLDRVTAVGTTFLGMTVNCASCHDHKYDPLTQKEFYSLFAFFNNLDGQPETAGRPRDGLQPPFISLASEAQEKQLADLDLRLAELDQRAKGAEPEEAKKLKAQRDKLKKERDNFDRSIPKAMVMREKKDIRPAYFLNRGQYDDPGEQVQRGTPAFLPPLKKKGEVATRLDLAEWFVAPAHPLTARVAVNRFWQQLFGVGLVKTSEDMGAQGEVPSHPELLDHLAVRFAESGWDIKALMKEMVMSKTYRQVSTATPEAFRTDPENRNLARGSRFRLDAEMIRDQILATSGLLSHKMYGRSVKPPQPPGLWAAVTMIGERFKPDAGDDIVRRSLYTFWKRAMPPPQMTILNAPIRDACTARRERTNTPAQSLLLLNESEYMRAARHLAQRTLREGGGNAADRIRWAWETVTSELPDAREAATMLKLIGDLQQLYEADSAEAEALCHGLELPSAEAKIELAAWTLAVSMIYNLDITKTRE